MQEKVDVHSKRAFEKVHELRIVELRLQQVIEWHLSIGTRDHHVSAAAIDGEHANLVAGNGQVDSIPLSLQVPFPMDQHALFGQVASRIFVTAKFEGAASALKLTFMVPLLGEGHDESLLAFLALEGDHGLLDIIIVCLELLFKIHGLLVQPGKSRAHAFQFSLPLDSSAMFRSDVHCYRVQQVLIVVSPRQSSHSFQLEDVLQGNAFQVAVAQRADVNVSAGLSICATFSAFRPEFVLDKRFPAILVFHRHWSDKNIKEICTGLDTNYVQHASFCFREE